MRERGKGSLKINATHLKSKTAKPTVKILHFLPQVIKISSVQTEEWGGRRRGKRRRRGERINGKARKKSRQEGRKVGRLANLGLKVYNLKSNLAIFL